MIPIVTPAEMRDIDAEASEPLDELIARAAWFVARRARSMLGGVYGRRVAIVAGPGNNGADARVAGQLLAQWGVKVEIVSPESSSIGACDLVIDGAFGTGLSRPYQAPEIPPQVPVLAIDTPSGVHGLTGESLGTPLQANHTVTFAAYKPGMLLEPGASHAGHVEVVDIGLDCSRARAWLVTEQDAATWLPRRAVEDHKWRRAVYVIGGSPGMYGAPLLASRAALRSGSGMVWCGLPGQPAPGIASELVFQPLPAADWNDHVIANAERFGALVVGCGLGRSPQAERAVRALLAASDQPLVLDGDALRLLGDQPQLRPNVVLTPHEGEFASVAGAPVGPDRFAAVRDVSVTTGATVLLKGPTTIVASPDGTALVTTAGDERLATAGTGDVLAGMIGSYLAAGLAPAIAAALGAYMHGIVGRSQPGFGMVASDLVAGLPQVTERLLLSRPHGVLDASN